MPPVQGGFFFSRHQASLVSKVSVRDGGSLARDSSYLGLASGSLHLSHLSDPPPWGPAVKPRVIRDMFLTFY